MQLARLSKDRKTNGWPEFFTRLAVFLQTLTDDSIVILDEKNNVCPHMITEVRRYHRGAVQRVRQSKKPVSIIVQGDVYTISHRSAVKKMTKEG